MAKPVYAHTIKGRPEVEWETLEDHCLRVAVGTRLRAEPFGAGDLGTAVALLHDIGKIKPDFQKKLFGKKSDTPHSGEGAKILWENLLWRPLAAAIAGHHGRLPDHDRLKQRMDATQELDLPDWCTWPDLAWPQRIMTGGDQTAYRMQFLVRMLYGALCDADDRETAAFCNGTNDSPPQMVSDDMCETFTAHMAGLGEGGKVNDLRREVLAHARTVALQEPGLFTLTVPTGGGKTLTSLGFGLDHARAHGLRRLIYVIPYTSIVEQTVDVFRKVLDPKGERNVVLEHHSNADWGGEDESEAEQRRVAGASWDVPVVVTTAVQFFESLHAARKKRCRKLPSLAQSVIVLDEAQTMPLHLLRPCLAALRELMEGYGASIVLSTATQPALTKEGGFPAEEALEGAREIAPDPADLFKRLERVEVRDVGPLDDAALADEMRKAEQALCIVDNRMQARALFDALADMPGAVHLSTLMVPAHRRAVLAQVRADLKKERPVRLVSTSLIEAGVDVDFPLVLRAAAGIDSIAQAAGRCNREGKRDRGLVKIFRSEHPAPPAVEHFAAIGRAVLAEGHDNPIGEEAVASYFSRLWDAYGADALDKVDVNGVGGLLRAIKENRAEQDYEQIEAAFRMIPDGERSIIICDGAWGVPWDELEALRFGSAAAVAKRVQPHAVNVPWGLWKSLWAEGHVTWWQADQFEEQFAVLQSSDLYDDAAGLGEEGELGAIV